MIELEETKWSETKGLGENVGFGQGAWGGGLKSPDKEVLLGFFEIL